MHYKMKIIKLLAITSIVIFPFQNCSKYESSAGVIDEGSNRDPLNTDPTGPTFDPSGMLKPISDPNRPELTESLSGDYEIKYVESREDEHLKLSLSKVNNSLYITDTGSKLATVSYTLNGWTDIAGADQLNNEPILPYRLYHLTKWSAQVNALDDWWKTVYENPKADAKRSELFFYIVKKGDTWNPVGQSNNPIGRPYVFSKLPAFNLKNRTLQFEYHFSDETEQRKKDLNISYSKENHIMLIYSHPLSAFIQKNNLNRGLHDFTKEECIAYADTLPTGGILAFDIEPGHNMEWIINYDAPNYSRNLEYVIQRLKEKGTIAYDWMYSNPVKMSLDGVHLNGHGSFGDKNNSISKFKEAYSRLNQVQKNHNYYEVASLGYGYKPYDVNLSPLDEGKQNFSPQLTYLQSLNAGELYKRAYPNMKQINFNWAYQEFDVIRFPQNHVVNIPEYNARALRTDNKPLYPPNQVEDNMTLSYINAKYAFYWSPNSVSWNPASTSYYNSTYTNGGFSVWSFEQGTTPPSDKAYLGKEAMAISSAIQAASNFSKVQDAADGTKYGAAFKYKRAQKDGSTSEFINVNKIEDGSWYMDALMKKQPFCIILTNNGKSVVMFQDVWARPGRWTEFEFSVNGKTYKAKTEGNRLFTAVL
jgi:hypothetical protein